MIADENPDDWIATTNDRVYYRSKTDQFGRGEHAFAEWLAGYLEGWTIVITMGPYRSHDIRHDVHPDSQLVHLDMYSAGMAAYGPEFPYRRQHPAVEHAEPTLNEIVEVITNSNQSVEG